MAKSRNSKKYAADLDLALALELQSEAPPLGVTENAVFPDHRNKENYEPRTLVDQTLEIIDPTPNIYTLFMQFNVRFFSNKLLSVEVKWSSRMTSCAGVCSFHPRSRDCVISLSAPLLKLRPRKDLVETLLHEMIHGYLFLTNNNRDRDGHGPEFCKHMDRINKEAGTHITIYHSFHDEVKLYQQHWWRCNGPCQQRHPFFGMVRRAMNRAPGPSDFWWKNHQQTCGGEFVKVREPEKKQKASARKSGDERKKPKDSAKGKGDSTLDTYFKKPQGNSKPAADPWSPRTGTNIPKVAPASAANLGTATNDFPKRPADLWDKRPVASTPKAAPAGLVKLGTATNNVHGWGTGGPGSSGGKSGKSPSIAKHNPTGGKPNRTLSFSGTVGGVGTGRSNLLDKFSSSKAAPGGRSLKTTSPTIIVDSPPAKKPKLAASTTDGGATRKANSTIEWEIRVCPVCNVETVDLEGHLDYCLTRGSGGVDPATPVAVRTGKRANSVIEITSSPETPESSRGARNSSADVRRPIETASDEFDASKKTATKHVPCPVCNDSFEMDRLNEHLDRCLAEPGNRRNTANKGSKMSSSSGEPSRSRTSKDFVDLTDETPTPRGSYVCLVCNTRISGDVALNDHLDDCVQAIFNDSTIDDEYNDSLKSSPPENAAADAGFPCPICMKPIPEQIMNQHLDTCLSGESWD